MLKLTFAFLLFTAVAAAEKPLRVYYESGDIMEQVTDNGLTLTVTLRDTGKENWLWVYISNKSNDAVNLIPANINLHQNSPKDEDLRMKSERETQRSIGRHVFWGQVIASVGAGLSRSVSTVRTKDSHGNSITTVVNTPDYEAQARWLALADQQVQKGQALSDFHQRQWLRANTLFAGSEYAGRLIFTRDKTLSSGYVKISLDTRDYEFPFPPPKNARPPQAAPELPTVGAVTTVHTGTPDALTQPAEQPAPVPQAHAAGVLGISGANWQQADSMGVEIVGVAPDSAAQVAGLHEVLASAQLRAGAGQRDPAPVHQVGAVGQVKGELDVLLHEQHADAALARDRP